MHPVRKVAPLLVFLVFAASAAFAQGTGVALGKADTSVRAALKKGATSVRVIVQTAST